MKLEFELVPDGCWKSNLRSVLSPKAWDFVRHDAYARAEGKCMICGNPTTKLEAHEVWEYDTEKGIQRLKDVVAICTLCHKTIHIERTTLTGGEKEASEHFMKVNGCSYAEYRKIRGEANALQRERSKVSEWALDLNWLSRFLPNEK